MSNEVATIGKIEVPAYLAALIASDPSLAHINDDAMGGLKIGPSYPMITTKQSRFFFKEDGELVPINQLEIDVVVVAAKPVLEKAYYIEKYDPSNTTDPKAPDCFSRDGVNPDPSCSHKQNATCQGCPMNEFGSGTDQQGRPSKGKACADNKLLAVFAAGKGYGMKIPPNSLKPFAQYVKNLTQNGLFLPAVITRIGFAVSDTPQFQFKFMGVLNEDQARKIIAMRGDDVVKEIVSVEVSQAPAPVQAQAKPQAAPAPAQQAVSNPFDNAPTIPVEAVQVQPQATATPPVQEAPPIQFNAVIDEPVTPAPVQQVATPAATSSVSDSAVRDSLGLDL